MRVTAASVTVSTTDVRSVIVTASAGAASHDSRVNHTLSPTAKPTPWKTVVVATFATNLDGVTPDTTNSCSVFEAYFTYSVSPANL